jgi:hypothetical protein
METELRSLGPGIIRTPYEPQQSVAIASDIERRRKAIAEKERAENLERYRGLVFLYADRALSDEEIVEVSELCHKLNLPSADPDKCRRSIREAAVLEKTLAEPEPDFAALDVAAKEANAKATEALAESIADYFRGQTIEQIQFAKREIYSKCGWLHHSGARLPDRKCDELISAAASASAAHDSASRRKPDAEAALTSLRLGNQILWPADKP